MKLPRLITRRRVKWAGVVASVVTLVLLIGSTFYVYDFGFHTQTRDYSVGIHSGWFLIGAMPYQDSYRKWNDGHDFHRNYDFSKFNVRFAYYDLGRPRSWAAAIPLWFPLLLIAAPTAYLWRTDRRAKPWQCAKCRYDLRGLDGGVCPECGEDARMSTIFSSTSE